MKATRYAALAALAVVAIGFAVPYVDANGYRERIQNALEQGLHRRVSVGKVRFNVFTGPGFTAEDVIIHDDPSIGIEPIAYVGSLAARVRLTTLWTRNLSFSNLRLSAPTVNLSKGDNGWWNFQALLRDASARAAAPHRFPSIQVRGGRINFKFGDYKSIFYLGDADLDVTPVSAARLDIRFSGLPARTDQLAQNFGRLLGRGAWKLNADGTPEVDANIELERSGISDMARLIQGHTIGMHGIVASRAHISGAIDKLHIAGQLRVEEIHRWDLLPNGGAWELKYQGIADLVSQRVDLATDRKQYPDVPFLLRFRVSDYLSEPKWAAVVEVQDAPVSTFLEVGRHMGASLPEGFAVGGKVVGSIGFSRPGGVQGRISLRDSSVRLANAPPLQVQSADVVIGGDRVRFGPAVVALSGGDTASVQGVYDTASGAADLEVATSGMKVAELRTGSGTLLGGGAIPLIEASRHGAWRGALRYVRDGAEGAWSGSFELRNARLEVEGLKEPVRVTSAIVEVDGPRFSTTQLKGFAGSIAFRAEYRHDRAGRPARLKLDIPELDAASLERLFLPALRRDTGLLARFHLRRPRVPEWLASRSVEATVHVDRLDAGDRIWSVRNARVTWDGVAARIAGFEARSGNSSASGELTLDLSGALPRYRVAGKLEEVAYRGGTLSIDGKGTTQGTGIELLANARGSGSFAGDDLTLSPDTEFESIAGAFEVTPGGRLRLNGIQAAQGPESWTGQGASQADGRVMLELTSARHQVIRLAVAK